MCIRDRSVTRTPTLLVVHHTTSPALEAMLAAVLDGTRAEGCLLYTSDAADERSSVDLGGRRIIKKNNDVSVTKVDATYIPRGNTD